jgi:hypothetical protein
MLQHSANHRASNSNQISCQAHMTAMALMSARQLNAAADLLVRCRRVLVLAGPGNNGELGMQLSVCSNVAPCVPRDGSLSRIVVYNYYWSMQQWCSLQCFTKLSRCILVACSRPSAVAGPAGCTNGTAAAAAVGAGGDGLVAGRHLTHFGYDVQVGMQQQASTPSAARQWQQPLQQQPTARAAAWRQVLRVQRIGTASPCCIVTCSQHHKSVTM